MTRKLPPTDVVIIGLGWTGSILAHELTGAGCKERQYSALENWTPRGVLPGLGRVWIPILRHCLSAAS